VQVEASTQDFDTSWRMWREQIGDYDGAFVDSQEKEFYNCESSFEEDEEDDSEVGEYGVEDVTSLEDILGSHECLHNVYTYTRTIHQFQRERKRRKLNANSLLQGGIISPLQGIGLQAMSLEAPPASQVQAAGVAQLVRAWPGAWGAAGPPLPRPWARGDGRAWGCGLGGAQLPHGPLEGRGRPLPFPS
jgi:hypothetical protein